MKKPVGHYEIEDSKDGQFFFNLISSNGNVLATSETEKTKQSIKKAIRSTRWNAFWGGVIDKTKSKKS
jgi:hypothetical protein